jgi:putative ABC transport system permease protein
LLIACANLANLTLARTSQRSRDVAVRLALGATRRQIVGQLLAESLTISLLGAAAGMLVAHWCIQGMLALKPGELQRAELIGLNVPVFLFAVAASICTAVLFGLTPAISAARADLNSALKTGGSAGSSAARLRSRQFLIAAEVALAVILLSGAGLMIRSFRELIATGIGFSTAHLTAVDVDLPETRYPDGAAQSRFFRRLIDRARSIPGVAAVSVVDRLPLHSVSFSNFLIEGRPDPPKGSFPVSDRAQSSPEYFNTIGLPLRAGRFFTEADLARNEQDKDGVVIVNESFARKFFYRENPIGKRLMNTDRKYRYDIVGIVADYRPMGVENGPHPQIFSPYLKVNAASLLVRTRGNPEALANEIRTAVWSIDKDLPADKVETMDSHLDEWQSQRKFNTLLLTIFAGLALVLALIGVYGVLSNLVAARTREIGIRMAIGATPAGIGKLVIAQSMIPVAFGLALGLAGSLALSRLIAALLFHVHPRDPMTLGLAIAAILLLSPLAIYVPLRRAIGVDCTVALREE